MVAIGTAEDAKSILTGKRLLLLGGQQKMCDVVERAHELGVCVVVTDWYENSPAKRMADKACNVSIADVDAVLALIREEKIDGVFTGFIDSYLPYYREICERAGLPCYLNERMLACSTDKALFKQICREVGLDVIPDADISDPAVTEYPVVIKPVDNSGSKGITVCSDAAMLRRAVDRAKRFSRKKRFLAEKFLDCDYIAAYYTVRDGEPRLTMLTDKDVNRVGRGKIPFPAAYVTPSRYQQPYLERIDPRVRKLTERLGFRNGSFLISFFVNGARYYAVELAARLTSTREYVLTGEDLLGMHIRHALTGEFRGEAFQNRVNDGNIYCMLLHFIKEGTIGRIEGLDEIRAMNGVLDVLQYRDIGAAIRADGSYGQLFYRVYLQAADEREMIARVEEIQRLLNVVSTEGRPMLVTGFDARSFFDYSV